MPKRKPPQATTPPAMPESTPTPAWIAQVATLQERVDNFHSKTFPEFCTGLKEWMARVERKLDGRNGDLAEVKGFAEEWRLAEARKEGQISVIKFGWKAAAWLIGALAAVGGTGGGVYWLLGRITGHI